MAVSKDKSKSQKRGDLDRIKQNIFAAKTEKEKKMWEAILRKLTNEQNKS